MRNRQLLAAALAASVLIIPAGAGSATAAGCDFTKWTTYQGTQLYRNPAASAYFYVTHRAAVDADGAPNAYHPNDVGKPCGATGAGLDCPSNAGYPDETWWSDVLAKDPTNSGIAYVQASGPSKGFFVSKTALFDPGNPNERDTARYVDATTVPYLVFPGPFYKLSGTGKLGDLGVAYHAVTKKWSPFIVADIGPGDPLGETSIAFLKALGGSNPNPRTGSGVAAGDVLYVVFPRSVDARPKRWPVANNAIAQAAKALLDQIGGTALFQACWPQ